MTTLDVLIPTWHPGPEFREICRALVSQTLPPRQILVINTERSGWDDSIQDEGFPLKVRHISRQDFDHALTRRELADWSDADVMVFMTQDAHPADERLLENLVSGLRQEKDGLPAGACYARQLPKAGASRLEAASRRFNYPASPHIYTDKDKGDVGIRAFFCSNVCASYSRRAYEAAGGFEPPAIFNEDMVLAHAILEAGFAIAYAPEARVFHSHTYSLKSLLHRNFDLGVSQACHPEVFGGVSSEGEGLRLVKRTAKDLISEGRLGSVPGLALQSGCKYMGFFLGRHYKKLPRRLILRLTGNRTYWERKEKADMS